MPSVSDEFLSKSKAELESEARETATLLNETQLQLRTATNEFNDCQHELTELKSTLKTTREDLMSTIDEMASVERDRQKWESQAHQLAEAERTTTEKLQREQQDLALSRDDTQRLVDANMQMERMLQVADAKSKELTACIHALMKFPDVSLGHEIADSDLDAGAVDGDRMLKDMITGNSVRISILEQKNNDLRMARLNFASRAASPNGPITKTNLVDGPAVQKAKHSLSMQHLEQQAGIRPTRQMINTRASSQSLHTNVITVPRPRSGRPPAVQSAWGGSGNVGGRASPMSSTKFPPEDWMTNTPVQGVGLQQRSVKSTRGGSSTRGRWSAAMTLH
ncbi:uncharacterized protein EV422DRAFT_360527 [Fimicolochytrium jonesii]|uniref:uncharacterized protein n=1 Tax=Fimicolochytrium jonesii TaxID=1396493 RepID=UPI0022FE1209|nr:uncharacterized protein EV422DRAFT_360527 [Fimicolochytrium jonesii]KAI8823562.1 hypothetical protein EV422DRAFT_360527 [Fimicolochytrium jonesii]